MGYRIETLDGRAYEYPYRYRAMDSHEIKIYNSITDDSHKYIVQFSLKDIRKITKTHDGDSVIYEYNPKPKVDLNKEIIDYLKSLEDSGINKGLLEIDSITEKLKKKEKELARGIELYEENYRNYEDRVKDRVEKELSRYTPSFSYCDMCSAKKLLNKVKSTTGFRKKMLNWILGDDIV